MMKKYLFGCLAAMVTALMFSLPAFADIGAGSPGINVSDNAFHSVLISKFDKHESVMVADADATTKEYFGGMVADKSIMACASCHFDVKSKHKALNIVGRLKLKPINNGTYQVGVVRYSQGKIFRPG